VRSSRRNKLAAITTYVLIAGGVIGGMSWGTYNSYIAAKEHVEGEISRAVGEIDNYMSGIISAETARSPTDYTSVREARDTRAYLGSGLEIGVDYVVLPSRLAKGPPPHDWIDVYFQVDPRAVLSSPQLVGETGPWPFEPPLTPQATIDRARLSIEWLKNALPDFNLGEMCESSCAFHPPFEPPLASAAVGPADSEPVTKTGGRRAETRAAQRRRALREQQRRYLAPEECIDAGIFERNLLNVAGETGFVDEARLDLSGEVSVETDPITTFWLGEGPDGGMKLAFLRECHADALIFYQGFVGDWEQLRPELLAQIEDQFPGADLVPILEEEPPDTDRVFTHMTNLPVRLQTADSAGRVAAAAWRRIRGTVVITWAAAVGVLVLAAWGLRNLVALTERRLQFAYAVTHELRTPLTTFRLYSDMLSAGLVPEQTRQEYLDTLNAESTRLSTVVEEVLEYARLENHNVKLNPVPTDGGSLIGKLSESLVKTCEANALQARTENLVADGTPLRTDVDLVNRIAGVLVSNACRHARGTDGGSVLLRLDGDDHHIHLHVIDSGPGIDRSDVRTIFRPFRRGQSAGPATGGIGLGLALARSWAQLLGGRLELASGHHPTLGGAHFRLTIPSISPR
jgi:signal transduction histidine kinase